MHRRPRSREAEKEEPPRRRQRGSSREEAVRGWRLGGIDGGAVADSEGRLCGCERQSRSSRLRGGGRKSEGSVPPEAERPRVGPGHAPAFRHPTAEPSSRARDRPGPLHSSPGIIRRVRVKTGPQWPGPRGPQLFSPAPRRPAVARPTRWTDLGVRNRWTVENEAAIGAWLCVEVCMYVCKHACMHVNVCMLVPRTAECLFLWQRCPTE